MDPHKLPEWLTGMQAVTWLVTADVAWTLRAVPKRERETERLAPIDTPRLEIVELAPNVHGAPAPLSPEERASTMGDPDDWAGGITLSLLNIKANDQDAGRRASEMLVSATRAGNVRTIEDSGTGPSIETKWWRTRISIEHPSGKLVAAPSDYKFRTTESLQGVLFARDDVLNLAIETAREIEIKVSDQAVPTEPVVSGGTETSNIGSCLEAEPQNTGLVHAPKRTVGGKPTKRNAVAAWVRETYPDGIPAGVKYATVVSELSAAGLAVSERTLRRSLGRW